MRKLLAAAVTLLVVLAATSARATVWTFNVNIDGQQEVPPQTVPISPGTGSAIVTFDDATGAMLVNGTFTGLTAPANNAHIHGFAPEDVAAGVLFGLTFAPATSGAISGTGSIPLADVSRVLGGETYINIHSAGTYAAGEIRGQLINPIPEPTTIVLAVIGFIALGVAALRRRTARVA
jgi:hypothetical protein